MSITSDARFWDRSSRKYAKSSIADLNGYERTLERTRAYLQPGDSVLELGCGTGTTALRLADGVQSYLATDISGGMIAIAEEKLAIEFDPGTFLSQRDRRRTGPRRKPVRCRSGLQLSAFGAQRAGHATQHPRPAEARGPVHLENAVPGRHEPADPAAPAARDASDRKSAACQLSRRIRAGAADCWRGFRHSCQGEPRQQGQGPTPLHCGPQAMIDASLQPSSSGSDRMSPDLARMFPVPGNSIRYWPFS